MQCGTSENALSFGLDPRPKHWMQARACRHIAFRAKDGAHALLNVDQLDEAEARIVGVEEKIDIAMQPRLIASH